jgi:putative intracellular protease/amidase
MSHILVVVTSHGAIEGEPRTGVWFSEFSEPLQVFLDAGAKVTVASPKGGPAPIDPRGYPSKEAIADARDALELLNATRPLAKMKASDFDAIFVPGGHGPMFDLANEATLKQLVADFWRAGKAVGAVCHGPASLLDVKTENGSTLLKGRRATGFSGAEDATDPLFAYMPFSLEDRMRGEGARYSAGPPHSVHTESYGLLVTGQNPASAAATAHAFLSVITKEQEQP